MLKSHEKFHSAHGKRLILIADDELSNRELLAQLLSADYEVIFATDGQETLDMVNRYKEDLSLVLLDLMMPLIPGLDVLREMKASSLLRQIPVIVLTADQKAEVESLIIGASDFIPKPYPQRDIVLARIRRTIELSEDREIILSTERDPLTGLYNPDYFFRYAEQYDQHHRDTPMDAIVVDINHFHMINERFGSAYGDEVLRKISNKLREAVSDVEGIVCRHEPDMFLIYCPHGKDYNQILESACIGLDEEDSFNNRIRLRLGVYACVDKGLEIERRFGRARVAADTVKDSFTENIACYDESMHEKELYNEQLIDDFQQALEEKQFIIYYQPKFSIRNMNPFLCGAEALVRWKHPVLGLIAPGVFIPLLEEHGLIQELDSYVWREVAAQIREWKDRLLFSVPISVNISRVDMYSTSMISTLEDLLHEFHLRPYDIHLEVTESAYTQDSAQILETVTRLREKGFEIEMDDFGTGYSSLNFISTLPLDALKLDMQFVKGAFQGQKDTRMLEVVLGIASRLGVPVIAEGIETEDQFVTLRDLGCDIIQGFYFSRPIPPEDFLPFLEIRKSLVPVDVNSADPREKAAQTVETQAEKAHAVHLRSINYLFVALVILISALLVQADIKIFRGHRLSYEASNRYILAEAAARSLDDISDTLTEDARSFVVSGENAFLTSYLTEAQENRGRDSALEELEGLLADSEAYERLSSAMDVSNQLMQRELLAMRLAVEAFGLTDIPQALSSLEPGPDYQGLEQSELQVKALSLMSDKDYRALKDQVRRNVQQCIQELRQVNDSLTTDINRQMRLVLRFQVAFVILLLLAVAGEAIFTTVQVRLPLAGLVERMKKQEKATPAGAAEIRFVSRTYNDILTENIRSRQQLRYEATHDALTGLRNRYAYEAFMEQADKEHIALLIIDVDKFKTINDTYGHDVGDQVLKWVADKLSQTFRSVDAICRLGGDEFVVVMTRTSFAMAQMVRNKIHHLNQELSHPKDGLPKASLSVGVAFSDQSAPGANLFKDADIALYKVKTSGRGGCMIYGVDTT